jgi:hypothetical protein
VASIVTVTTDPIMNRGARTPRARRSNTVVAWITAESGAPMPSARVRPVAQRHGNPAAVCEQPAADPPIVPVRFHRVGPEGHCRVPDRVEQPLFAQVLVPPVVARVDRREVQRRPHGRDPAHGVNVDVGVVDGDGAVHRLEPQIARGDDGRAAVSDEVPTTRAHRPRVDRAHLRLAISPLANSRVANSSKTTAFRRLASG